MIREIAIMYNWIPVLGRYFARVLVVRRSVYKTFGYSYRFLENGT